jgi:hypothetical protein
MINEMINNVALAAKLPAIHPNIHQCGGFEVPISPAIKSVIGTSNPKPH